MRNFESFTQHASVYSLTKGKGDQKSGGKYIKRIPKPGGGYHYVYPKDVVHHASKEKEHREKATEASEGHSILHPMDPMIGEVPREDIVGFHEKVSAAHREGKLAHADAHAGKVIGQTKSGTLSTDLTIEEHTSEHPSTGKAAMTARTTPLHASEAPHIVEYGGKTMVKQGHNSDSGDVSYHEHDPKRELISPDARDGGFKTEYSQHPTAEKPYGKFSVQGMPELRGGSLPSTINDPHHGKLTMLSHNSDSRTTVYTNKARKALTTWGNLVKAKGDQKSGHKYKSRKPDGKGGWVYDYGDGKKPKAEGQLGLFDAPAKKDDSAKEKTKGSTTFEVSNKFGSRDKIADEFSAHAHQSGLSARMRETKDRQLLVSITDGAQEATPEKIKRLVDSFPGRSDLAEHKEEAFDYTADFDPVNDNPSSEFDEPGFDDASLDSTQSPSGAGKTNKAAEKYASQVRKYLAGEGKFPKTRGRSGLSAKEMDLILKQETAKTSKALTTWSDLIKAKGDQRAGHKYKSRKPDGKGAWLYDYGDGKGFRAKKPKVTPQVSTGPDYSKLGGSKDKHGVFTGQSGTKKEGLAAMTFDDMKAAVRKEVGGKIDKNGKHILPDGRQLMLSRHGGAPGQPPATHQAMIQDTKGKLNEVDVSSMADIVAHVGKAQGKEGGSKTVKEHLNDDTPPEAEDLPESIVERIEKYKLDVHGENLERVIDVAQRLEAGIDKAADICKAKPAVCAGNMGIPRADMPQIMDESVKGLLAAVNKDGSPDEKSRAKGKAAVDAGADPKSDKVPFQMMLDHLKSQGVGVSKPTATPVGALKATQRDIQELKASFFAERQMLGVWPNGKPADVSKDPIVISNDGHILDGHHRWAALAMLGPDMTMNAIKVDLPMHELLSKSFETPGAGVFRMDMQNKVIEGGQPDYKKYKADADASLKGAGPKKEDKKAASLKAPGFNQLWKANQKS